MALELDEPGKRPAFFTSIRFLVAILAFFGYAIQYAQKIDMSVAIVCMINNTALTGMDNASYKSVFENISESSQTYSSKDSCQMQASAHKSSVSVITKYIDVFFQMIFIWLMI
jgi:hypothetical protein